MIRYCFKYCLLLACCQLLGLQVSAQGAAVDSLRSSAKVHFEAGNFATALPYSEKLLLLFPAEGRYMYQTGVCLSKTTLDLQRAYRLLKVASQKDVTVEVYYYLGDICRRLYRFEEAIEWFRQYMVAGGGKVFNNKVVEGAVTLCENGIYLTKYATNLQVLGRAKVCLDSILYYYTVSPGDGQLGPIPQELISKLDRKKPCVIPLAVYYPSVEGGDPEVIYFTSYGKTDMHGLNLWKTTKTDVAVWEQPTELPSPINSEGDEIFPIPALAGTVLYFASNAHIGMGGYDIFKTEVDPISGKWSQPENMGFPINSPADDFFFVPDKDGKTAMFASNRDAVGDSVLVYKVIIPLNGINLSLSEIEERVLFSKLNIAAAVDNRAVNVEEPPQAGPKARVEGLQYDLTYMELMTSLASLQKTLDSIQKQVDIVRIAFQQGRMTSNTDSIKVQIVTLEERQRNILTQIAEVNRSASIIEEAFLAKKEHVDVDDDSISRKDFFSIEKVVGFFGRNRILALRRVLSAAIQLDTVFYRSLELLREEQDLETMLTATDQPEVVKKINQALLEVRSKSLLSPNEFLGKRMLLSVGLHNLIKERLLVAPKDSEQEVGFQAANADMISAQGIFYNNKSVSATLDTYEGIRDGLWVEERGLLRYKLVIAQLLNLNSIDSLKLIIQGLEHRSSIPFYVFEQPKPKEIQPSLRPEAKPAAAKTVKLKSDYSVGLMVVDPFPYGNENPIPFDEPLPAGVIYKIQLGAFSQPIIFNLFKGLAPITGENLKGGAIKKYYAGKFFTLAEAQVGLVLAKSKGFKDAFIISWLNGKVVPLTRAQNFEERKSEVNKAVPDKLGNFPSTDKNIFRVVIGTFDNALPSRAQTIIADNTKNMEIAKKVIAEQVTSFSVGNFANFEEALRLKEALLSGGFVEAYVTKVNVQD